MCHLNVPRLVISTSCNNFFEKKANKSDEIARQSLIKVSQALICIYTGSYSNRCIETSKKDLEKFLEICVIVDRT